MNEKTLRVQEIYVYIYLPRAVDPVLAGKITSIQNTITNQKKALFKYAESYFLRPDRLEIDPLRLPFKKSPDHIYETDENNSQESFSVIYDSIPDAWGKTRMLKHAGLEKMSSTQFILASGEDRSGFLAYGLDTAGPAIIAPWTLAHSRGECLDINAAALVIDEDQQITLKKEDAQKVLIYGSSLGGARPKVTIRYQDRVWLAKPPKEGDPFHFPRAEFATMNLAKACGLLAPEVKIISVNKKDVYLIERFDRFIENNSIKRSGFLSMFAAIGYPKKILKPQVDGSYLAMASTIGCVSKSPHADQQELFKRILFNALVGNDDDHLRNHGFYWTESGWRLSPLFDVVPRPFRAIEGRRLNQGFGNQGNLCTVENFLSRTEVFSLSRHEALKIINEMLETFRAHWQRIFKESEVPPDDLEGFQSTFSIAQMFERALRSI